jgi:hypothetical protein
MPVKKNAATKSVTRRTKKAARKAVRPRPAKTVARKASAGTKPVRKKAKATKPATKTPARKRAVAPRKRAAAPRISAELMELAREVAAGEGVSVRDVIARVRFVTEMEGTTLEEGLREAKAWIGIDGDELDEWAEKETCKCGRPMPGWWNRKAYPSKDAATREYLWAIRRCECGFAPEEITGRLAPPKSMKK